MSDETLSLFDRAGGSPVVGYMLLRSEGKNVPPSWIERYQESRRNKHDAVAKAIKRKGFLGYSALLDWEESYKKEYFYQGIRILMELDRNGESDY